jgi:hypothetical protein
MAKKSYSCIYLLNQQPKGIKRKLQFKVLHEHASRPPLRSLRFSMRCYSLLNRARIKPELLNRFLHSWSLPRHPFFADFLSMKRSWLKERAARKKEKQKKITMINGAIAHDVKKMILRLRSIERHLNVRTANPLWKKKWFTGTLKRARELSRMDRLDHAAEFYRFIELLSSRYQPFHQKKSITKEVALFVLCVDKEANADTVKKSFRTLSKVYHPDLGGNHEHFQVLKKSLAVLEKRS